MAECESAEKTHERKPHTISVAATRRSKAGRQIRLQGDYRFLCQCVCYSFPPGTLDVKMSSTANTSLDKLRRGLTAAVLESLMECNCEGRRGEEIFAEETKHQAWFQTKTNGALNDTT